MHALWKSSWLSVLGKMLLWVDQSQRHVLPQSGDSAMLVKADLRDIQSKNATL